MAPPVDPSLDSASSPLRVLGVDPGTRIVGWGVVESIGGRYHAIGHGVLRAPASKPVAERLALLADALTEIVSAHTPTEAAIEEAFHGRDASAALRIGEARGALVVVLSRSGLPVAGYANNVVKKAVTGAGRASKEQVQGMVRRVLGLDLPPATFDAADALAVAICHLQRRADPATGGGGVTPRIAEALRQAGIRPRSRRSGRGRR